MTDEATTTEQAEESPSTAPKKTKKKAAKKSAKKSAKKAAKKSDGEKKGGKVGICDQILRECQKEGGATVQEIVDSLAKKFPDRDADKMRSTVQHQVRDLPTKHGFEMKKNREEGRGLVYKAPARIAGFK